MEGGREGGREMSILNVIVVDTIYRTLGIRLFSPSLDTIWALPSSSPSY